MQPARGPIVPAIGGAVPRSKQDVAQARLPCFYRNKVFKLVAHVWNF